MRKLGSWVVHVKNAGLNFFNFQLPYFLFQLSYFLFKTYLLIIFSIDKVSVIISALYSMARSL
jgi:hypothetical protein